MPSGFGRVSARQKGMTYGHLEQGDTHRHWLGTARFTTGLVRRGKPFIMGISWHFPADFRHHRHLPGDGVAASGKSRVASLAGHVEAAMTHRLRSLDRAKQILTWIKQKAVALEMLRLG
jgi:hypothetical protein